MRVLASLGSILAATTSTGKAKKQFLIKWKHDSMKKKLTLRAIKGNTCRVLERGIQVARDLNELPCHDDRFSMEEAEVKKKEITGRFDR